MPEEAPPKHIEVAFLGVAERSSVVRDGILESVKWNILGLKHLLVFNFFPANISGLHFVFALRHIRDTELRLEITSDDGQEIGWINVGATITPASASPIPITATREHVTSHHPSEGWSVLAFPLPQAPIALPRPGRYFLTRAIPDSSREIVGEFWAGLVDPPPLTAERIAAIKSDPRAMKAVRVTLACGKCKEECRAYAGLERNDNLEKEGFVWYTDLPEQFRCHCGATSLDITSIRRNLYAPL
jgi:hypothetical protein